MFRRRRSSDDFAKEIQAHLELETERLVEQGMSPEEARVAARRAFGNVTSAMERFHESGGLPWLDHLRADVRTSMRSLAKYPVACAVAVVSLAGGIGATTAALTVRDVVFRKPPVLYREPEQLSRVQVGSPDRAILPLGGLVPGALAEIWRDASEGQAMAAAASVGTREVRVDGRTETRPVRAVTPEFFSVLGVSAALGHTFSDLPSTGAEAPAVLSHGVWHTLFDGRPDVVGRVLWIENRPYTVVGVIPPRFWFTSMDSPIWTRIEPAALPSLAGLDVVMRRRPDVTPQRLSAALERGLVEYAAGLPARERALRIRVSGVEGTPVGRAVSLALPWLLAAAVFLTLLIACANVAILVIAQWTAREHEIAIRAALGGSRGRIVRLLLTESFLIAAAGGLLGICATFALVGVIIRSAGPMLSFFNVSIEPAILLQSMVVTMVSGILAGLGPALLETRRLLGNPLRTMSSSTDRVRQRWRNGLVALEITVTVALLVTAATMVEGYRRSLTTDLGFPTERLIALRVENGGGVDARAIVDLLHRTAGIASAAASTTIPYAASGGLQRVAIDASGSGVVAAERGAVGPAFFETLGVSLRAGRGFTEHDSAADRIAIVNETLAARLWPGRNPIGQHLWIGDAPHGVVGVVADYRNSAFQNPDWAPKMYVPFDAGRDAKTARFLARSSSDPVAAIRTLRREIAGAAAGNVVSSAFAIDQIIVVAGQEILVGTAPLVPLVATGMLLTAAGIYGVLAFAIARRSKEFAVRIAIGATGRDVVRLVAAHSVLLVAIGVAGGVGGTYLLVRAMRAFGGAGSVFDPTWPAFVAPALIIVAVAALASWIPSRRALRIDPSNLLRMT